MGSEALTFDDVYLYKGTNGKVHLNFVAFIILKDLQLRLKERT